MKDENSKRTRVEPVFRWLQQQGGEDWPTRLLRRAEGIAVKESVGIHGSLPDSSLWQFCDTFTTFGLI
jgi:hypothetical protein